MTRQATLSRQAASELPASLIEEILLECVLSGGTLPRVPRHRPFHSLLERPRAAAQDDGFETGLRWAA